MDILMLVVSSVLFTLSSLILLNVIGISKGIKIDIDRITEAGKQINKTIEDKNSKGNLLAEKVEKLEQQVIVIRSSFKGR